MNWLQMLKNEGNMDAIAFYNRGVGNSILRRYEEAILDFDKAVKLDPNLVDAFRRRGIAKSEMSRYEEAMLDFRRAINFDPNFALAFYDCGIVKYKMGRHEEAILDYDKAIKLDPNLANAFRARGIAKSEMNKYAEAILDFEEAIKLNPKFVIAFYDCGIVKNKLGRYEEAILYFDKALKLDPIFVEAFHQRGIAKSEMSRYAEAILDFEEAIKLDSNLALVFNDYGIVKLNLRRYTEAILYFDKAIEIDIKFASAFANRGATKVDMGRYAEVIFDYHRAIYLFNYNIPIIFLNKIINFFANNYSAPFLVRNILITQPIIRTTISYSTLASENDKLCYPLTLWLAWLNAQYPKTVVKGEEPQDKNTIQSKNKAKWLRALICFHAGDLITALQMLDELDYGESTIFHHQYFLVRSADSILHEERKAIRNYAKRSALAFSESLDHDEIQNYWAARLLIYCNEFDAALKCLEKCQSKNVFHYLNMAEAYRKTDRDESEIIRKAQIWANSNDWNSSSFLETRTVSAENRLDDYLAQMEEVSRYFDAEEIINNVFADGQVKPRFWEIWDAKNLVSVLRQHWINDLDRKLKAHFEAAINKHLGGKIHDTSFFKDQKDIRRWEAYKSLKNSEDLVFEISSLIINSIHSKEILSNFLDYFYLLNKIPLDELYYLYFYLSVFKQYKTLHQSVIDGTTESGKVIIENTVKKLIEFGFLASITKSLSFLINPVAAGVGLGLAVLAKQFLLNNMESTNKEYKEFKVDFQKFIFEEYERLGEEMFYKKYPLDNFENFLKRK